MNVAGNIKSRSLDADGSPARLEPHAARPGQTAQWAMLLTVLVAAAALVGVIFLKLLGLNQTPYHNWPWSDHSFKWTYGLVLPCVIPFLIAQGLYRRRPGQIVKCLGLLCVTTFVMMITCSNVQHDPLPGPGHMLGIVLGSKYTFGYFSQAMILMRQGVSPWQMLAHYPQYLAGFERGGHPGTKPPGPVLFEAILLRTMSALHLMGDSRGKIPAVLSGLTIAALATLAVPATYKFIKHFTQDKDAAFFGASYLALCPSLLLVFPQFDQTYILLTVALTILWGIAVKTDDLRFAALFGLALGASEFISYLPTVLGIFLLGYAVLKFYVEGEGPWSRLVKLGCVALAGVALFYAGMYVLFRFNPVGSFQVAMQNQAADMNDMEIIGQGRHVPRTIPWDFFDFALGSGYISYLLVAFYFTRATIRRQWGTAEVRIAALCILQIVLVSLTGAIKCETARVWIFMLPMLALPIGLELSRWNFASRMAVYMALLLLTAVICQRMSFAS